MRIMRVLKVSLLLLLLLEITGFVLVAKWIGIFPMLLLILATTLLGIFVVRHLGFTIAYETMRRMQRGGLPPEQDMMQGWLMFAGFLLILPGFFTDILGLLLLLRPVRQWIANKFRMKKSRFRTTTFEWYEEFRQQPGDPLPGEEEREHPSRIIEGEFVRNTEQNEKDDKKE